MKSVFKSIARRNAAKKPLSELLKASNKKLILPFYHCVANETPVHIKRLYQVRTVTEFKNDLIWLLDNFHPVSLDEVIKFVNGELIFEKPSFHLSFDDGLAEVYEFAFPILKELNVPFTVFLNSDFVNDESIFYRFRASILAEQLNDNSFLNLAYAEKSKMDVHSNLIDNYLKDQQLYLDANQIKEMLASGVSFGAHSVDHPLFKDLKLKQQIAQVKDSLSALIEANYLTHNVFSFPFTDDGVTKTLFENIKAVTDITFGCAGVKDDEAKTNLQRIPIEKENNIKTQIKEELAYYGLRKKVGKHLIKR